MRALSGINIIPDGIDEDDIGSPRHPIFSVPGDVESSTLSPVSDESKFGGWGSL